MDDTQSAMPTCAQGEAWPHPARSALIFGGARSGKTARALALAQSFQRRIYIATAEAFDAEMRDRIVRHQAERDDHWGTIEAPHALAQELVHLAIQPDVDAQTCVVVDCLTLWLSNCYGADRDIGIASRELIAAIGQFHAGSPARLVFVSNEVGLGIVPDNALARAFRDAQGRLNQDVAAAVDHVEFVAAGLPLTLKRA